MNLAVNLLVLRCKDIEVTRRDRDGRKVEVSQPLYR